MSYDITNNSLITLSLESLEQYLKPKFSAKELETEEIKMATAKVESRYDSLGKNGRISEEVFSEHLLRKYIKSLSLDRAPGLDGIKPEHPKSSLHTTLPVIVSNMLTVCLRYGVLPKSFYEGLMVSILKKSNLDPGVPSNYRNHCVLSNLKDSRILYA